MPTTNNRKRNDRNNQGVLITGMTGSGKSRMAQAIAGDWRRRLIVDPTASFDAETVVHDYEHFIVAMDRAWRRREWSIACNFRNDREYARLFAGVRRLRENAQGQGDFVLVLDEVDMWSSAHDCDEALEWIVKYGRHNGVSWIAVCRADVDTNGVFRRSASEVIMFAQGMLSPDMLRKVKSAASMRKGVSFPPVETLTPHGPSFTGAAVEGQHFVAVPKPFAEWRESWRALSSR